MKTKCNNTVERFYDRPCRASVTRVRDPEGNQIGDADYSGNKKSADYVKAIMIKENGGTMKRTRRLSTSTKSVDTQPAKL